MAGTATTDLSGPAAGGHLQPRAGRPRRVLGRADDRRASAREPDPRRSASAGLVRRRQVRVRLDFTFTAYSGTLHLYAVDWDSTARRENVTVDDGRGPRTVSLAGSPSTPAPGCTSRSPSAPAARCMITVDTTGAARTASSRALFLGAAGPPPTATSAAATDRSARRPGRLGRELRRRRLRPRRLERHQRRPLRTAGRRHLHPASRDAGRVLGRADDRRPSAREPIARRSVERGPGTTPARSGSASTSARPTAARSTSTRSTGISNGRRENVTVDDGSGPRTANLTHAVQLRRLAPLPDQRRGRRLGPDHRRQ